MMNGRGGVGFGDHDYKSELKILVMRVLQGKGPDAERLSDLSVIAPCLIMPSVCLVSECSSEALVT